MRLLKSELRGEWQRDPHELAGYRDPRVKATQEEIARQLHGNWQADGVFRLKQELQAYIAFVKP
jgi:transposase